MYEEQRGEKLGQSVDEIFRTAEAAVACEMRAFVLIKEPIYIKDWRGNQSIRQV